MFSFRSMNVLVIAADDETARRWRDHLVAAGEGRFDYVGMVSESLPDSPTPDVVLVVETPPTDVTQRLLTVPHRPGLVSLGSSHGDVVLNADASVREVALACWLLGQLVRQAREQASPADDQLRRLAMTDPLTGVGNRRAWDAEFSRQFDRSLASGGALSIAIVDIDHFKAINDDLGHLVGDAALAAIAQALTDGVRQDDFVARLGGDEFGVILPGLSSLWIGEVLDRIHTTANVALSQAVGRTSSVSIGAACGADLFVRTDTALRSAKQTGRNRVVVASSEEQELARTAPAQSE
jgi:diguanylate cyclase (GGDEF)-like protein